MGITQSDYTQCPALIENRIKMYDRLNFQNRSTFRRRDMLLLCSSAQRLKEIASRYAYIIKRIGFT